MLRPRGWSSAEILTTIPIIPTTNIKLWIDPNNGKFLGKYDEYEIKKDGKAYLAPVIDDVVREINVEGGYVLITPMKGIFDDAD